MLGLPTKNGLRPRRVRDKMRWVTRTTFLHPDLDFCAGNLASCFNHIKD
jgi:hypothetical protein